MAARWLYLATVRFVPGPFFVLVLLIAAACGDRPGASPTADLSTGQDAILLRLPREGGIVRAYRAASDSVIWRSRAQAPITYRVLGFDEFQGQLVALDSLSRPYRIDLRLGSIGAPVNIPLRDPTTADGWGVFGLDPEGALVRLTPEATWRWTTRGSNAMAIPQTDRSVLVLTGDGRRSRLQRLIPPEMRVLDSASLPGVRLIESTVLGDRLWVTGDSGLLAVQVRSLQRVARIDVGDEILDLATTPSGDRVFLATVGNDELQVVDRYANKITQEIDVGSPIEALRMDPDGRYLLARVIGTDSVRVISIGTSRVVASFPSEWRADLPLVTPDGGVLLLQGSDAVLVDAESGRERLRHLDGASDWWSLVRWNGFRPRAAGLDRPVEFDEPLPEDAAVVDSVLESMAASAAAEDPSVARAAAEPTAARENREADEARDRSGVRTSWTVSFASLLQEDRARELAKGIKVDGRSARVLSSVRDGVTIWRVLLGPFNSREAAERAGMSAGVPYWVFEGVP